jgi:ATP-dependent Clp protease ATP-binding subunit ClpB
MNCKYKEKREKTMKPDEIAKPQEGWKEERSWGSRLEAGLLARNLRSRWRRGEETWSGPNCKDDGPPVGRISPWKGEQRSMHASQYLDPTRTGRDAETLDTKLRRLIVGQNEAIEQIVNIYQLHLTGLSAPGRPIGNFLFLGPTGSGKTRIVEATAESLLGNPRAVIKIDCAEFQHSHEIAKLIGSPPGYLGHRETHPLLSQEVLNAHQTDHVKLSFVLFDEIEKASDALWNLLLGILDKANLTLGDNRRVDFSRTMIFMTSNLGANEMSSIMNPKLGFAATEMSSRKLTAIDDKTASKISRTGTEAARRKFTPEFINRLDKIVVFKPLGESELRRILDIELSLVQQRVFNASGERSFVFTPTDAAKEHLLREGTDLKYGARHLKRAIERLVVQPISNLVATEQVRGGDWIKIDFDSAVNRMTFFKEAEGLPIHAMAELVADTSLANLATALTNAAAAEAPKTQSARSSRRT